MGKCSSQHDSGKKCGAICGMSLLQDYYSGGKLSVREVFGVVYYNSRVSLFFCWFVWPSKKKKKEKKKEDLGDTRATIAFS